MKERRRSILHVDLDPFFVSVERSLDPSLRERPVIVGGDAGAGGLVAAASAEARGAGVRPGQSMAHAQRLCPAGVFRAGDLDTYGRISAEVTAILLAASRRVERPTADEAYVDLTPEHPGLASPVPVAETIKNELQRRLGLDAALGLASSRLAARVASSWARPRGLLVVLPGYEMSFLARKPVSFLEDLPPHLENALQRGGYETLGQIAEADEAALAAVVGAAVAPRLREAARGEGERPIPVAAPPAWLQEEAVIRDRHGDQASLEAVLSGLAARAGRRLRPFGLGTRLVTVEVRRADGVARRSEELASAATGEEALCGVAQALAHALLAPAGAVRAIQVRLSRLAPPGMQAPLFPDFPQASGTIARGRR